MKNILFITNQLGGGGSERVLTLLANKFSNKHNISILALKLSKTRYKINSNIEVMEMCANNLFESIYRIKKIIKKTQPDVIISFEYHVNMKVLLAIRKKDKIRIVVSERNDPKRNGGKIIYKQIRNILYSRVNYLVCQTPDAKAYFPKYIQKKTVVIPNPVKDNLPKPWSGKRKKVIVNFCRLEFQKNLKLLIDAYEQFVKYYPDFILEIYGDGSLREDLENYIKIKNLQTKVKLYHAVDDIHERIKAAYMFVSTSDYEGLSNSMIEAMAMGIPVICTDCPCGGAKMVIKDRENGLLVPVGKIEPIVTAMKELVFNQELNFNISKSAIQIRYLLSCNDIAKKWESVCDLL